MRCGAQMKVVSVITTPTVIDRILFEVPRPNPETGAGAALWGPLAPDGPDIVLRLSPPQAIEGIVTPVAPVVARAIPANHPYSDEVEGVAATADDTGRFRIDGLGPGDHRLRFTVPDGYVRLAPVTARSGSAVHVKLATAVAATIEVVGTDGKPVADAYVRVAGLEPGKLYTLQVGPFFDGMLVFERGIHAEAGRRRVKLIQGGTIRGTIELPKGLRGERVEVFAVGPGFGARGRVAYGGDFRIIGVPEGRWTVRARARTEATRWSASMRARPGDRVELKLGAKDGD